MTIIDAIALYLSSARASGMRPATVRLRGKQLHRFARQVGPRHVERVTIHDIEAWVAVQEWAPNTARSHRAALRVFFAWCAKRGIVDASPAEDMPLGPTPRPNPRPVDDAAYRFALQVAGRRERLMLRLAAESGLRRGEVAQVHTRDLFEDLGGWSLVVHGKGGKVRHVPLKADIAAEIRTAEPGYLFPGQIDGHLSAQHVGVLVRRLLPGAYSMHKLRTRFGTRVYAATHDIRAVQELLGHSSPVTTQAYIQVPQDALRAAVNAA